MENKLIIANMKMYMNYDEIKKYLLEIDGKISKNVIFVPTSIYIPYFLEKKYLVALQNIHYENNGAFTGEISTEQAKSMNINYVIIGHSERRDLFQETDYDLNKKVLKVLENNMNIVLCIGEGLEDRNNQNTEKVLREQLEINLNNVSSKYQDNIIIAYEPKWAIGTGIVPSNEDIRKVIEFIKNFILEKYKMQVKVLYGGSVNEVNVEILNKIDNIDGFIIGGACTKADKFLKMISIINNADII